MPYRGFLAAASAVLVLLTSGCGALGGGLRGVDLPGGAALGDAPYTVTIEFTDVVDLVPQSLVKVADVSVGSVTDIRVGPDWTALVTVAINGDVELPADAQARVRTTSLLGEKFVELLPPSPSVPGPGEETEVVPAAATRRLAEGDTIPLLRTGRAAEVEEVLGALSMLLNGGGVAQIRTIASELNKALDGNEPQVKALLSDLDKLVGALDDSKDEITRAIDEINRLSITLNDRKGQIKVALDDLSPGLRELEDQRGQLVDMLQSLDRLSGVATHVVNRSHEDVVADLKLLKPTLTELEESGSNLVDALPLLPTIPFTDYATTVILGDYGNADARLSLDLGETLGNLGRSNTGFPIVPGVETPPPGDVLGPLTGGSGGNGELPLLGGVLPGQPSGETPSTDAPQDPNQTPPPVPPSEREQEGLFDGLFGGGQ